MKTPIFAKIRLLPKIFKSPKKSQKVKRSNVGYFTERQPFIIMYMYIIMY